MDAEGPTDLAARPGPRRRGGRALRHRLGFALAIVLVAGSVGVALGELRFRAWAARESPGTVAAHQRGGDLPVEGGWARSYVPALSYVPVPSAAELRAGEVNRWGLRDREIRIPKPAGVTRVVVLGDSMTAGTGVDDPAAIWPRVMERELADGPQGAEVDVVSAAVPGYQALQQAALLEHRVLPLLEPDLVLYAYFGNDTLDIGLDRQRARRRFPLECFDPPPPAEILDPAPGLADRVRYAVRRRSSLWVELRRRGAVLRYERLLPWLYGAASTDGGPGPAGEGLLARWFPPNVVACPDYDLTELAIRDLARRCERAGVDFAVVAIPSFDDLGDPDKPPEDRYVTAFAERSDVEVFSPLAALESHLAGRGVPREAMWAGPRDTHPGVEAHHILGVEVARFVRGRLAAAPAR